MTSKRFWLVGSLSGWLALSGCLETAVSDAGTPTDAGTRLDAGPTDSGTTPDAGGPVDAGLGSDAGATETDAGAGDGGIADGGVADAGGVDAGVDAGAPDAGLFDAGSGDAGQVADAGTQDAGVVDAGNPDAGPIRLVIAGRELLGPNGQPVHLYGGNLKNLTQDEVNDLADDLSFNFVRLRVSWDLQPDGGADVRDDNDPTEISKTYRDALDNYMTWLTAKRIWVLIEMRADDTTTADDPAFYDTNSALFAKYRTAWEYIAERYKTYDYVAGYGLSRAPTSRRPTRRPPPSPSSRRSWRRSPPTTRARRFSWAPTTTTTRWNTSTTGTSTTCRRINRGSYTK